MKSVLLSLLLLGCLMPAVYADNGITISQSLDKAQMAFEDSALFEIVLTWPGPQSAYLFDKPLQPSIDRLKIRGYSSTISSSTANGQEVTTKTYHYVLIPTSSGEGKIDPVTISYVSWPDSTPGQLTTEPMSVTIALPIPPKKPMHIPPLVWIAVLAGFSLTVVFVVYVLLRKGKKVDEEPVKSPKEMFLEGLSQVRAESGQDLKKFQSGLYKILTRYLADAYLLPVGDQPEEELKEQLKKTPLKEAQVEAIAGWLIRARRDKFSPVNAQPGEVIRLESEIRELFEKLSV